MHGTGQPRLFCVNTSWEPDAILAILIAIHGTHDRRAPPPGRYQGAIAEKAVPFPRARSVDQPRLLGFGCVPLCCCAAARLEASGERFKLNTYFPKDAFFGGV
jgi:hypothetical protein